MTCLLEILWPLGCNSLSDLNMYFPSGQCHSCINILIPHQDWRRICRSYWSNWSKRSSWWTSPISTLAWGLLRSFPAWNHQDYSQGPTWRRCSLGRVTQQRMLSSSQSWGETCVPWSDFAASCQSCQNNSLSLINSCEVGNITSSKYYRLQHVHAFGWHVPDVHLSLPTFSSLLVTHFYDNNLQYVCMGYFRTIMWADCVDSTGPTFSFAHKCILSIW